MFRIVHPFHPGCGRQFEVVTIRQNWGEDLLFYTGPTGKLMSVPVGWTDWIEPDPVVVISAGRSAFRLNDLLELTRLVATIEREAAHGR